MHPLYHGHFILDSTPLKLAQWIVHLVHKHIRIPTSKPNRHAELNVIAALERLRQDAQSKLVN